MTFWKGKIILKLDRNTVSEGMGKTQSQQVKKQRKGAATRHYPIELLKCASVKCLIKKSEFVLNG